MTVSTWIRQMPEKQIKAGKYLVGFFALILALTLVSRGLDSYTIPVVTTTSVGSGSIGQQVKVQGTIQPLSQIAVSAPAGHLVESVLVEEGGKVEEGDVLAVLSTSLLEEKLEDARREQEIARLTAAAGQLQAQREQLDPVEKAQGTLDRALEDEQRVKEEGDRAVSRAHRDLSEARDNLRELRREGAEDSEIDGAKKSVRQCERALEDARDGAEKDLVAARRLVEDAQRSIDSAHVDKSNSEAEDAVDRQKLSIDIRIAQLQMETKEKEIAQLEELLEKEGKIYAPRSGLVTKLNLAAGSVTGGDGILLLSDQSQGSLFRGNVDDKEGELLSRGDSGKLGVGGESVEATITALTPPEEKGKGYEVSVHLPDSALEPGLSGTLSVEKISQKYSQVVPLSALQSRGNSTTEAYVYVIRERNTTLGAQLAVEQVPVQILEQNSERAAIQGVFEQDDKIVKSSSRALSQGDRVRVGAEE